MSLLRLLLLLAATLPFWSPSCWAQSAAIAVVQSESSSAQQEFVESLRASLGRLEPTTNVLVLASQELEKLPGNTRLIIPLGGKATEAVLGLDSPTPVLAALLPRSNFDRLQARGGRRLSALFLDQPPERQMNLLRLALPDYNRVALLLGPESAGRGAPFASGRGLRIVSENVSSEGELFAALQRVLADADLLLAVPDSLIYNRQTLPNILLTTYRLKIPVIGFSPAYVRAGAALALYSTPAQIAEQSADIARGILTGRPLPPPQYPRDFSISINAHVARALGLNLPEESTLKNRLRQMEHQP